MSLPRTEVYGYIRSWSLPAVPLPPEAPPFVHPRTPRRLRSPGTPKSLNALILAAGRGRRLLPYTSERPKCLLQVGPCTILEHQLRRLSAAGVERVTIVAGFGAEAVRRRAQTCGPDVRVVFNPFFAISDNLVSLWSARSEIGEDTLLLNGDNVFHPAVLEPLLDADPGPCTLLVHRKSAYDEDDMKVALRGGRLAAIGKDLLPAQAQAESIGIMRIAGDGSRLLRLVLEEAVEDADAMHGFYIDGVRRMVEAGCPVRCADIGSLPWSDIDTDEDLLEVRLHVQAYEAGHPAASAVREPA